MKQSSRDAKNFGHSNAEKKRRGDKTPWQAAMRVNRHNLDAAINAGAGGREHDIVPWIPAPNTCFCRYTILPGPPPVTVPDPNNYTVTADDCHRILELARAKGLDKIAVWLASTDSVLESYEIMKAFFEQVYMPPFHLRMP